MVTASVGDIWSTASNVVFLPAAAVAWRYGERLRALELFATCAISTLYHWCHERVVHKRRTDIPDPCPLDVQWRISKADNAISYFLLASMMLLFVPTHTRWLDLFCQALALLANIVYVCEIYVSGSVTPAQLSVHVVFALWVTAVKFLYSSVTEGLPQGNTWRKWRRRYEYGLLSPLQFYGGIAALCTATAFAAMLIWYGPWGTQATHGVWHMLASALCAACIVLTKTPEAEPPKERELLV